MGAAWCLGEEEGNIYWQCMVTSSDLMMLETNTTMTFDNTHNATKICHTMTE